MASLKEKGSTSKPKIDLLLREINEVKCRENEYLTHIKSLYHDEKMMSIPLNSKNNGCGTKDEIRNLSNTVNLSSNSSHIDVLSNLVSNKSVFSHCPTKKGIMNQFYTSRGKFKRYQNSNMNALNLDEKSTFISKIERDDFGKPVRKGYIPVEEKIHQELMDLQNREKELKLSRMKIYCDEVKSSKSKDLNQTDEDSMSLCKTNCGPGISREKSTSVVQLCDLQDNSKVTTSHELIEKWEYLIQERKQQHFGYIG